MRISMYINLPIAIEIYFMFLFNDMKISRWVFLNIIFENT